MVTVDPDLGLVRVERMAGAWGAGRILNHKTAENQMRGGGMMGIGQALLEGSATDPNTARLLNPGLNEYLIPTHADAPPISVTFIEEHDPCRSCPKTSYEQTRTPSAPQRPPARCPRRRRRRRAR